MKTYRKYATAPTLEVMAKSVAKFYGDEPATFQEITQPGPDGVWIATGIFAIRKDTGRVLTATQVRRFEQKRKGRVLVGFVFETTSEEQEAALARLGRWPLPSLRSHEGDSVPLVSSPENQIEHLPGSGEETGR